ncbi:hypothetical protein SUDANB19_04369 [Streptomyces sp. enrichment culture]
MVAPRCPNWARAMLSQVTTPRSTLFRFTTGSWEKSPWTMRVMARLSGSSKPIVTTSRAKGRLPMRQWRLRSSPAALVGV